MVTREWATEIYESDLHARRVDVFQDNLLNDSRRGSSLIRNAT